jgi:uncharacterized membrane protein
MNDATAALASERAGASAMAARPSRIAALDVARGVALVCMAIFHGSWDVAFLHIVRFDPGASTGWIVFARAIAGSFLLLVGISLVLSTRNGFRPKPYLKRLGMIVAAAALVSVATYFAMPEGWIFFGILHQIALASRMTRGGQRRKARPSTLASAIWCRMPKKIQPSGMAK